MAEIPSPLVRMSRVPDLLVKTWPAERVLEGMMVCKALRSGLLEAPLVNIRATSAVTDLEAASRFLHRFTGTVELECGERGAEIPWSKAKGLRRAHAAGEGGLGVINHPGAPQQAVQYVMNNVVNVALMDYATDPSTQAAAEGEGRSGQRVGSSVMQLVLHASTVRGWAGLGVLALRYAGAPQPLVLDLCRDALPNLSALTTVDLEGNSLPPSTVTALCDSLTKLPNLSTLNLSDTRMGDVGIVQLSLCLPRLTALTDLNLTRAAFRANSSTEDFAWALSRCTGLATLNLSHNFLGTVAWFQQLVVALPDMSSLTRLNLAATSEGFSLMATSLPSCQQLRHLDLSCNSIRVEGAMRLAEVLKDCERLETLVLSNNLFGEEGTSLLVRQLPSSLRQLVLSDAGIGPEGAGLLAKVLPGFEGLTHLDVSLNVIGKEGISLLAKALPRCTQLRSLNLGSMQCGNDAGIAIAEVLPSCTRLEALDLRRNNLTALGAWKLAWGLPVSLQTLNLSSNTIGDIGARYFAGALPHCNVSDLDLAESGVGDEGANYMAEAVPRCHNLKRVNLSSTPMGSHGARVLMGCLDRCVLPPQLVLEGILHTC